MINGGSKPYLGKELDQMNLRMNLLCILGAAIGLASLFTVWTTWRGFDVWGMLYQKPFTGLDLLNGKVPFSPLPVHYSPLPWTDTRILSTMLVLAGSLIALVSPLGGFPQIAGALYFLSWSPLYYSSEYYFSSHFVLGIGPFIALGAGLITLLSIVLPAGPHCRDRPIGIVARLLSISRVK
jgi:hypothetical protein